MIDSHAHLTYPELAGNLDGVLDRCRGAGITRVITIGTTLPDARQAVDLVDRYPDFVSAGVGFHPHHAAEAGDSDFSGMRDLWDSGKIAAIGELGLDYHYDFSDRRTQRDVLDRQLREATARSLPIIVHCREAFDDLVPMLLDHGFANRRVVFHCFTGTKEEAAQVAEHGWRISFTGIVTFKNSKELQEIAKCYPEDQLMVETDSPYLSPEPVRGKRPNEPAHVRHVVEFLARLRNVPQQTLARKTEGNTREFFGIGK